MSVLCLLTVGQSPQLSVVSDLSWYASYIFLYLLIRQAAPPQKEEKRSLLPFLGPAFALAMAAFFMQWGEILSNLIYGALMGFVMFTALRRLVHPKEYGHIRLLCLLSVGLCFLEYAMWTVSGYYKGDDLSNPYYLFDLMITVSFPFFIRGTEKAVAK